MSGEKESGQSTQPEGQGPAAAVSTLTISGAQAEVDATIRAAGGYWPPLANLARLFEECGELARAVNQGYGPKRRKDGEAAVAAREELGDVFYVLLVLANSLEINAATALAESIAKVTRRNQASGMQAQAQMAAEVGEPAHEPGEKQMSYQLQSLDDAIAALEIAALLAEAAQREEQPAGSEQPQITALQAARHAFVESQPEYQALYHYRNALAMQLRTAERARPKAVEVTAEPPADEQPSH